MVTLIEKTRNFKPAALLVKAMRVTRRFWLVAAVGVALALWGIVTAAPSLLVGAGTVGAWMVSVQYAFLKEIEETLPHVDVAVRIEDQPVTAEESATVTVAASVDVQTRLLMRVTATTPVGVDGSIPTMHLDDIQKVQRHAELYWPVAGEFDFDALQVTLCDWVGLFSQRVTVGEGPKVVVEPRAPRDVHVGRGGDEVLTGFGRHDTGQTGSGVKPAEVREYVPGDAVKDIDWKATARLAEAHVREFEVETDRETKLILDHREVMGCGPDGERKLDYARQLALAILANARTHGDPIGYYGVGDGGLTASYAPSTSDARMHALRTELLEVSSTVSANNDAAVYSPAAARRRATRLEEDSSPFAMTLHPYFAAHTQYVQRVQSKPLVTALNLRQTGQRRTAWSVVLTDDSNKAEVREAINVARELDAHATVFLTPTVLFEPGALDTIETAYDRYVEFESFRRDLELLEHVSAFELGPADRLSTVLRAGQSDTSQIKP